MMVPSPQPSAASRAHACLASLLERSGVLGALLVSRDGLPVMHAGASFGNLEMFAAMQATALGAAEMALDGIEDAKALGIVIDLGDRRVLSRGITPDLVMILMVERGCAWERAFEWMTDAGEALSAA